MSGLYNLVHGINHLAGPLLIALKLSPRVIPRFRDTYVTKDPQNPDEVVILVYTRTGGGNRPFYEAQNPDNLDGPWNSTLRENPHYLRDEDDQLDSTYAKFYFKLPDELVEFKAKLLEIAEPTPEEKWQATLDAISGR